jgi:hypothetical protein
MKGKFVRAQSLCDTVVAESTVEWQHRMYIEKKNLLVLSAPLPFPKSHAGFWNFFNGSSNFRLHLYIIKIETNLTIPECELINLTKL